MHATEDAFLDLVDQGKSDPVLLFFQLTEPGISISSGQNLHLDVDVDRCVESGVSFTRRETGGRSVYLDQNHFIASFITRLDAEKDPHVWYDQFCSRLCTVLGQLVDRPISVEHTNDLVLRDGRKIGGAAQRQRGNAVLLHAYIRYTSELARALPYLRIDNIPLAPYVREFETFTAGVSSLLTHRPLSLDAFFISFRSAFADIHSATVDVLTVAEQDAIKARIVKYTEPTWILGTRKEPSRGNCDLIAGTTLRIKELEGRVSYK